MLRDCWLSQRALTFLLTALLVIAAALGAVTPTPVRANAIGAIAGGASAGATSTTAPATSLLVKLRDERDASAMAARAARGLRGQRELAQPRQTRVSIRRLDFTDAASAAVARAQLALDPRISTVESNSPRKLTWEPNDPALNEARWWLDSINAPAGWDITTGASDVLVAVIDSGVSPTQPDLVARLVPGYNAVDGSSDTRDIDGHGTHVAGIIAAQGGNAVGAAGVAMDVRILPVRVMNPDGSIDVANEIAGIYWAVDNGADVINLSLGAQDYVQLEREAIQYAYDRGVVVVAASGNEFNKLSYPANYPETISVGALDAAGLPASFTSRLTRVDVAAPGESIFSPGWDPFYGDYWDDVFYSNFYPVSGTSFSAPMVAGAAALLKSIDRNMGVEQVRNYVRSTAKDTGPPGLEAGTGAGELNVEGALRAALGTATQTVWRAADEPVASGVVGRSWLWGAAPLTSAYEPYDETQYGTRFVLYYDKSRMEVTDPLAARDNGWYVTNGLLVAEMISGRLQVGDNRFVQRQPAAINVAGDPNDTRGPTYASFAGARAAPAIGEGAPVVATISRDGTLGVDESFAGYGVTGSALVGETGHRIASVFWDYLNSEGPLVADGGLATGPLFAPWFYATGYPLTEAYWAKVVVAGVEQNVLIQCFERRCLTYTPDNPAGWQVEMGNVGRHYYAWRYGAPLP